MRYFAQSLQINIIGKIADILLKGVMFFLMLYGGCLFSQSEALFTQTSFNPAFINPAYAGSDTSRYFNIIALNRSQTTGFDKAPNTTILNVNGPLHIGNTDGGLSVTLLNDQIGFLRTPSFNVGYAYKTGLGKGSLSLGLSAGVFFSTLETESWKLPEGSADPAVPTGKDSKQSFDIGLGIYYSNNKLYVGLSGTHLLRPVLVQGDNSSKLPQNYYLTAGYRLPLNNPDIELKPALLMLSDLKSFHYSLSTLLFYRNKFWVGLDYRIKSSLGFVAGMNILPELRIGYSYGYNTSLFSRFAGGNHEVMLTYRFSIYIEKGKQKYKSIRYL
ncbi:MAG: PorP/SprF family type IX secretion system membrane protein [Prevotellaceae bacterium]|jgi:type IX secretion system PorP/SprF family membrane protein|nr:PorP/SprF family type IX secretion system membrane protein [Prevotellaceae bacterium]